MAGLCTRRVLLAGHTPVLCTPTSPPLHLAREACSSSSLRPSWARSSSTRCCCSTICSCSSELSPSSRRFSFSSSWRFFSSFRRRSGGRGSGPCVRAPHPHAWQLPKRPTAPAHAGCKAQHPPSRLLLFPASPSQGAPQCPPDSKPDPRHCPLLASSDSPCPCSLPASALSFPPRLPSLLLQALHSASDSESIARDRETIKVSEKVGGAGRERERERPKTPRREQ